MDLKKNDYMISVYVSLCITLQKNQLFWSIFLFLSKLIIIVYLF